MNIGERVSGRYKIIERIGSGGMANVYLAEDLILEREVAVKMMALDFEDDQSNYRRFQREAASTTELIHPNIVNIFDVGEGDQPYIVMEYVDGMDLKQYIRENHPIPYQKVLDIMKQLLDGIAYAHANGVIHRDIKPHNIMIDREGNIKITDFGIAVALTQNSITQTNSMLGSVQYISPEQARGNVVTKQSDVYSLGIVLYELLTGSVPFDGESAVSIALKHFQSSIPSLSEFDSRIPQPLENVVLHATAKDPIARYDSVEDMAKDIETSLSPTRRDEPMFVPRDPSDEDTLVLGGTVEEVKKQAEKMPQETIIAEPKKEEETPEKEPEKKKKRWWLLLIPLLILVAGLIFILQRPGEVDIPNDIIGMTYEDAIELLEEHELLEGEQIEQANDEVEEGLVFRTSPESGATVREGSEVDLYVSLGEELFELEDYEGESFEEVRVELTEAGFTVESEEALSSSIEDGHIIDQDIDAGDEVLASEETITFTVSAGSPFTISDYEGQNFEEVRAELSEAGFTVESEEEPSEAIEEGHIISQNLDIGEQVNPITETITFTVSTGRPSFTMNDLTGYSEAGVRDYANNNNLNLTITRESNEEIPLNQVISQEPAEDSTMYAGDELSVVISDGPEEVNEVAFTHEITIPYDAATSDNPNDENQENVSANEILIYKDDLRNDFDSAAQELRITEDTVNNLSFVVEEGSNASYRVERDGEIIMEEEVSPDAN